MHSMLIQLLSAWVFVARFTAPYGARAQADTADKAVDTTIVYRTPVMVPGDPDEVRLHLKARRFDAPFVVTIDVLAQRRVLMHRVHSDSTIDSLFADTAFVTHCGSYPTCKSRWYFQEYIRSVAQAWNNPGPAIFDRRAPNSIYALATPFLRRQCAASADRARSAVARMAQRLRARSVLVVVPDATPALPGTPLVWFAEFRCFAPIYEE